MRQRVAGLVRPERVEDLGARNGNRERQRAPGQCFRQRDNVRHDAGLAARERATGAAEAGEDFIENQNKPIAVCGIAQALQDRR